MKRQAKTQLAKKKNPKMEDDLEYEPDSEDEKLTNVGVVFPYKLYGPPPHPFPFASAGALVCGAQPSMFHLPVSFVNSWDPTPMNSNVVIPFAKSEWADIVRTTLEVDKELKPTIVRRTLEAKDGMLHVYVLAHPLRSPHVHFILTDSHTHTTAHARTHAGAQDVRGAGGANVANGGELVL
jgi:hypothetical protein